MKRINHRYYSSLLLLLFLTVAQGAKAQNLSIQAKIDRDQIKVGEQAVIDITVRTGDLAKTKLFLPEDSTVRHFEVLQFAPVDTIDIDGRVKEVKMKMLITSFDSVELVTIPPITVQAGNLQAKSNSLVLKVLQPDVDMQHPDNFKDIKKPWKVPYTLKDILILVYGNPISWVIIALLLALMIWYESRGYKLKREKAEAPQINPPIPPIERALTALTVLSKEKLPESGQYKLYYTKMTDILRHYIEEVKHVSVMEMTSTELIDYIELLGHQDLTTKLKRILKTANLAKFANYKSLPDEDRLSMVLAVDFIRTANAEWVKSEGDTAEERSEA